MNSGKTYFVIGGSGNQGSAVALNLAQHGYKVKALVRNFNSPRAQALKHENIELIKGDLDEPATYRSHLAGINGLFSLQTYTAGVDKEVQQGKAIVDAALEKNVPHFLYSSVIGANAATGIPHWESKNEIEQSIKHSGIPYTIIRPASLFENYLIPDVRKRLIKGKLTTPVTKDRIQQFISAEDIGKISVQIFINREKYIGRTFEVAADEMDMQTAAAIFSEVLKKPIRYSKLPGILTRMFMGKDLHIMFRYVNEHDVCFVKNMKQLRVEFPFMMTLKEWVTKNASLFR